jgi:signal transduction histidine kinase
MSSSAASDSEEILARLAHDLRQPLSTIETSAFCINLMLGREQTAVQEQLRIIERQVCHAVRILDEAVAKTRHRRAPHAKTATAAS